METTSKSKIIRYECIVCNYKTGNKYDIIKHTLTKKHKLKSNENDITGKIEIKPKKYICECSKKFKHASSLWNHKQKCNFKNHNNKEFANSIIELIKQNRELKEIIFNQNKQIIELLETQSC